MYVKKFLGLLCLVSVVSFEVRGSADSSTSTESDVEYMI